jgi:hypothetical protein
VLLDLIEKTKQTCLTTFGKMCFVTTSFDLWKCKGAYDVFALVVNFLGEDSMPKTHYILLLLSI